MHRIITIWKKEIIDTIRDKRTFWTTLIMPIVLMPLIIVGTSKLVEYQAKSLQGQNLKIDIVGEDYAPDLVKTLESQNGVEITKADPQKAEEEVKNEIADGALIIPQNFTEEVKGLKPVQLQILTKSTNQKAPGVQAKINAAISDLNNKILQERFSDQKINPAVLSKISLSLVDVATEKERGGFVLGFILPLLIVIWTIVGGMNTAVDASAGEKERKTLEALLLTSARRIDIVFGKFLAVATVATISVIASISSLYFTISYAGFGSMNSGSQISTGNLASGSAASNLSLDPKAILLLLFISLLLVALFSTLLLSIAIFAKSFKEAQTYLGPLYLIIVLPITFANTMIGLKPEVWVFALPGMNAILLFKEVLTGIYDSSHILVTAGSLILYSLIAIFIATKIYSKESVMFKS